MKALSSIVTIVSGITILFKLWISLNALLLIVVTLVPFTSSGILKVEKDKSYIANGIVVKDWNIWYNLKKTKHITNLKKIPTYIYCGYFFKFKQK